MKTMDDFKAGMDDLEFLRVSFQVNPGVDEFNSALTLTTSLLRQARDIEACATADVSRAILRQTRAQRDHENVRKLIVAEGYRKDEDGSRAITGKNPQEREAQEFALLDGNELYVDALLGAENSEDSVVAMQFILDQAKALRRFLEGVHSDLVAVLRWLETEVRNASSS